MGFVLVFACIFCFALSSPLLYEAIAKDDYDEVRRLVNQNGSDVNFVEYRVTALTHAAENGRFKMVELLLQLKAEVNKYNGWNRTAVFKASAYGHFNIVKLLVENGADVNSYEKVELGSSDFLFSPLLWAVINGHFEIAEFLYFYGAEFDESCESYQWLHENIRKFLKSLVLKKKQIQVQKCDCFRFLNFVKQLPGADFSEIFEPIETTLKTLKQIQ